jgi:hypothetical protein
MRGLTLTMAVVVALVCSMAEAGPFRRSVTKTRASTCTNGSCSTASTRVVSRGGAQQHAEAMASSGSLVHASNHGNTYEGIGMGSTPEAALASCCNNGGAVIEEGVAQGRGGRWFACRRYTR